MRADLSESWVMAWVKQASKAETLKQPSLGLRLLAPCLLLDSLSYAMRTSAFVLILMLSGCLPVTMDDVMIGKAPGYSFTVNQSVKTLVPFLEERLRQCMRGSGINVSENEVLHNNQYQAEFILPYGEGFLLLVRVIPIDAQSARVDVRYTPSWESSAFAVKRWVAHDYPLCIAYSVDKTEGEFDNLSEEYVVTTDMKPFATFYFLYYRLLRWHNTESTSIDAILDDGPSPSGTISVYIPGWSSISHTIQVRLGIDKSSNKTLVTVKYYKRWSRSAKAIRGWIEGTSSSCRI